MRSWSTHKHLLEIQANPSTLRPYIFTKSTAHTQITSLQTHHDEEGRAVISHASPPMDYPSKLLMNDSDSTCMQSACARPSPFNRPPLSANFYHLISSSALEKSHYVTSVGRGFRLRFLPTFDTFALHRQKPVCSRAFRP